MKKLKGEEREREELQAGDPIIMVTGDMKPSTWVNKGRIPALQHISWVNY